MANIRAHGQLDLMEDMLSDQDELLAHVGRLESQLAELLPRVEVLRSHRIKLLPIVDRLEITSG